MLTTACSSGTAAEDEGEQTRPKERVHVINGPVANFKARLIVAVVESDDLFKMADLSRPSKSCHELMVRAGVRAVLSLEKEVTSRSQNVLQVVPVPAYRRFNFQRSLSCADVRGGCG